MSFQDFNTAIQTAIKETSILNASNDHLSEVQAVAPVAKLKAKPSSCGGIWSLPFTAVEPEGENEPNFWMVPAAGGFSGGEQIGKAMACSYLKYLRDLPEGGLNNLSSIADSFDIRLAMAGGLEMGALDYTKQSFEYISLVVQRYAFFDVIGKFVTNALAKNKRSFGFDLMDNNDFIAMANEGLSKCL